MARRMWIAIWPAAGFVLGAAVLAGGQGDAGLREKLIEIEALSARLRALDSERGGLPAPNEQGLEFDCVHVRDLTCGVQDFCRPERVTGEAHLFSGVLEDAPQPYGTIEEIIEMVRTRVRPDVWETGSQMECVGGSLLLLAPPDVNRAVREFLDKELRPGARRTVDLRLEIVEVEEPLAAPLAAAAGGEIDPGLRAKIDEAVGAGVARRLFGGRVRALSRQQVVLWHGAEAATIPDVDVDPGVRSTDPVVDVELLGTIVQVRSTVTADRVRVQISLDHDVADSPVRTAKTEKAGTLQMPARTAARFEADLWTADERWAVAGGSAGAEGKRRFLLVRPTVIGGAR